MAQSREAMRRRRQRRVRSRVSGTAARPRLNVYRSLSNVFAQVIDDEAGRTLVAVSTIDGEIREKIAGKNKTEQARLVGLLLAERAKAKGLSAMVFDRGGYRYSGRVKALADGAREGGLEL